MDRRRVILEAEEQLARQVALGVIVERPISTWQMLIPGMFMVDFLRRSSAVRQFTRVFMFPRHIALEAAVNKMRQSTKEDLRLSVGGRIEAWQSSLKLHSEEWMHAQKRLVEILTDYYLKLLKADGHSFRLMLKNAYRRRQDLQAFFDRLSVAESEVDREMERLNEGKVGMLEKIAARRNQLAVQRSKMLDELF
jgi:hypothetical protein